MSSFGDYEPEDAWCATDTTPELVTNLRRRIAALDGLPERPDELVEISERLRRFVAEFELTEPQLIRAAMILDDVALVLERSDG